MAGTCSYTEGVVAFHPRFPFVGGIRYTVLVRPVARSGPSQTLRIERMPRFREATAEVIEIFPSAAELPANHLRFYIEFSAPMAEGYASTEIRMNDTRTGASIDDAILDMSPELWSGDRRRLTVFLEPGRIKRGLSPNLQAGNPIDAGSEISLTVDAAFRDVNGAPLRQGFTRRYRIGPPVRRRVDPRAWTIAEPTSQGQLVINFDRPLDAALAKRCLTVHDASGQFLRGATSLDPGETVWTFTPAEGWKAGTYRLEVNPLIEDLAGNSVSRVFDRDLTEELDDSATSRCFVVGNATDPPRNTVSSGSTAALSK